MGKQMKSGGWRIALMIAVAGWALYAFIATRSTLWDRDEAWFARASVEMAQSGNYLYSTFNGQPWLHKPILIFWLQAATIQGWGAIEWAARFWSPLATAICALLTFWTGRRLANARAGHLAMIVLLTTPLMVVEGTAATIDAVLLALTLTTIVLLLRNLGSDLRWWTVLPLGLALGAGALAKGPVGPAVFLLTVAGTWFFARGKGLVTGRHLAWVGVASGIGLGVFLAWAIPANQATGGDLVRIGWNEQVLERIRHPFEGHGGGSLATYALSLGLYPVLLLLTVYPWTFFLPAALAGAREGATGGWSGRAYLMGWCVPTFVLMSLVVTKLPHYILPIYPAIAVAIGATLDRLLRDELTSVEARWIRRGNWFFIPTLVIIAGTIAALPRFSASLGVRVIAPLSVLCLTVGAMFAERAWKVGRPRRALGWLAGSAVAFQLAIVFEVVPQIELAKPVPPLARQINAYLEMSGNEIAAATEIATAAFDEPSLLFYLGAPRVRNLHPTEVRGWSRAPLPGVLVIPREALLRLEAEGDPLPLVPLATAEGLNIGNTKRVELVALRRVGN